MAEYTTTIPTAWSSETAFDYLADFSSSSDWDPSIPDARCVAPPPVRVGARFEVDFEMLGNTSTLDYETVELSRPEKVVLRSEGRLFVSVDTMTFAEAGTGAEVTYHADVSLKGPLKALDPAFALLFKRLGDRARDGMRARLGGEPPAAQS